MLLIASVQATGQAAAKVIAGNFVRQRVICDVFSEM